jgi:polar amino acid transport system substrate-binding protein
MALRSLLRLPSLCCAFACFLAGGAQAQAVAKATGHPNWPPFSWQAGDKIIGIGPELTELVLNELGLKVDFTARGNWKRAQSQAEHGAVDLIVAAYKTAERERYLAYPSAPFMDDPNVIWVARGKAFPFRQWDDLIGRTGTAMLGESYGEAFDRFIRDKLTMEWVSTPSQSLGKLELGRADFYPFSLYGGQIQVRQLGFEGKIEHLPEKISTEGTYIAISRKSALVKYLPQIEAITARLRSDGTIERLVKKYVAMAAKEAPRPPSP